MTSNDTPAIIQTILAANPVAVFMDALLLVKLTMTISLIAGIAVVILAVLRRTSGGPRSGMLSALAWISLGFGMLGALYTGVNTYVAAQMMHVTRLVIVLPSIIEGAYAFLLGLVVWLIALWGNAGTQRR